MQGKDANMSEILFSSQKMINSKAKIKIHKEEFQQRTLMEQKKCRITRPEDHQHNKYNNKFYIDLVASICK